MATFKKGKQHLDQYITYHDILTLALAYTSIRNFSSDSMDWHRAFYEICQKYQESVPELRNIFFDHSRSPLLPPMANEVYDFQCLLEMSGQLEGLELGRDHISRIPREMRRKIKSSEEKRLAKYTEQIQDMAKIFDKHLKVKQKRR